MASDYLILKRRAQEDGRRAYEETCKEHQKLSNNATWEINSGAAIADRKKHARFEAIRHAASAALDARRSKLAALLAGEQLEYEEQARAGHAAKKRVPVLCPFRAVQLQALEETPAQRRARMSARATELKVPPP